MVGASIIWIIGLNMFVIVGMENGLGGQKSKEEAKMHHHYHLGALLFHANQIEWILVQWQLGQTMISFSLDMSNFGVENKSCYFRSEIN